MDENARIQPDEPLDVLLDRVEKGEAVVITRDGKAIARLVPEAPVRDVAKAREAAKEMLELAKGNTLGGLSIRDMIDEGRE